MVMRKLVQRPCVLSLACFGYPRCFSCVPVRVYAGCFMFGVSPACAAKRPLLKSCREPFTKHVV